jgi:hypothetical protein
VPDERYNFLCDLWRPPSMYPAYLHITDIAGLIRGASEGEPLLWRRGTYFGPSMISKDLLYPLPNPCF